MNNATRDHLRRLELMLLNTAVESVTNQGPSRASAAAGGAV
jgi:hypothetical protein